MHIFLIRHGESVSNAGENFISRIPDHLVPLTEKGKAQARENGEWLLSYCKENSITGRPKGRKNHKTGLLSAVRGA